MFKFILDVMFTDRVAAAIKQDFTEGNFGEKLMSFSVVFVMIVMFFSAIVNFISAILR